MGPMQRLARSVPIAPHVTAYAVSVLAATHPDAPRAPELVRRQAVPLGPGAGRALVILGGAATAIVLVMRSRNAVTETPRDASVVTVVADYRLYPEVRYPGFLEDGAQAVGWASRNAAIANAIENDLVPVSAWGDIRATAAATCSPAMGSVTPWTCTSSPVRSPAVCSM